MKKSVDDLMEKVRQYANDPSIDAKPRRPLTGYYAKPEDMEASSRVRPMHVPVSTRDASIERNSLPRMNTPRGDKEKEKSRSMEDLSCGSSHDLLHQVKH